MSGNSQNSILFIGELPSELNLDDVKAHFQQFDQNVKLQNFNKNNKIAIRISFDSHEKAEEALKQSQEILSQSSNQRVRCKISWNHSQAPNQHRPADHQTSSLIVSDFPPEVKPEDREQFISNILNSQNLKPQIISKPKFLIVNFKTPPDASRARTALSKQKLKIEFNHRQNSNNEHAQLPNQVALVLSPNSHHQQQDDQGQTQPPAEEQKPPEPIPTPEHAYLSIPVESGTLFFFDLPENREDFITKNQNSYKILTSAKTAICNIAYQTLDKRTIYADGFREPDKHLDEIRQLFETKGKVIYLAPHLSRAVIVQYETEEACKSSYELRHYIDQNTQGPLTILPYFNKSSSQKPEAGLIQINEFPPTKTINELTQEFSAYGKILATSISPTGFDSYPYGFVLFETYTNAVQAKRSCQYRNVFLYPPLKASEAIFAFTEGQNAPNNCLVIYDLPASMKEPEINTKCRRYGQINSSYVLSDGNKKAAYIYFAQTEDAVHAMVELTKEKFKCDLLNGNVLDQSSKQLSRISLFKRWQGLLLFVQSIPNEYGTANLREDLMSLGNLGIDSCFINLNPSTGVSNGHGIILTHNYQTSQFIMSYFPQFKQMKVSCFRGNYARDDPAQQPNTKYNLPQYNPKTSSREYIKQFIRLNFDQIKDQLCNLVDQMSVADTYKIHRELLLYNFSWVDAQISEISKNKAT